MSEKNKHSEHELPTNPLYSDLERRINRYTEYYGLDSGIKERVLDESWQFIQRNNVFAATVSDPNFRNAFSRQRPPNCNIAVINCVDDRLWRLPLTGLYPVWREAAGLVGTREDKKGRPRLTSHRLTEGIWTAAQKGEPLLEVSLGHYSSSDVAEDSENPQHSCGYMKRLRQKNQIPPEGDIVDLNHGLLQANAAVIDQLYNEGAQIFGKPQQRRTVVNGMIDTDTLGLVWGPRGNEVSIAAWTDASAKHIQQITGYAAGLMSEIVAGKIPDSKLQETLIRYENASSDITLALASDQTFLGDLANIWDENGLYPGLSNNQRIAMARFSARSAALTYLTGLYQAQGHPTHYLAEHSGRDVSLTRRGAAAGSHVEQVFSMNVADIEEAHEHVDTVHGILKDHNVPTPHKVFINEPSVDSEVNPGARAGLAQFSYEMASHPGIAQMMAEGKIFTIPLIVHSTTREVLEVGQHPIG